MDRRHMGDTSRDRMMDRKFTVVFDGEVGRTRWIERILRMYAANCSYLPMTSDLVALRSNGQDEFHLRVIKNKADRDRGLLPSVIPVKRAEEIIHLNYNNFMITRSQTRVEVDGPSRDKIRSDINRSLMSKFAELMAGQTKPEEPVPSAARLLPPVYTRLRKIWLRSNGERIGPKQMNRYHRENALRLLVESHGELQERVSRVLGLISQHFEGLPDISAKIDDIVLAVQKLDVEDVYPIFDDLARVHVADPEVARDLRDIMPGADQ